MDARSLALVALLGAAQAPVALERGPLVITPEAYGCNGADEEPDSECWQAALDAAKAGSGFPYFGKVEATPNARYVITRTLLVHRAFGGVIEGNGAILEWRGPSDVPMWLLEDTQFLEIRDFFLHVVPSRYSLHTAFELTNAWPDDPVDPNYQVAPSRNILSHIYVQGTNLNGLRYGVRFSNRYGKDENNDLATIQNCTFGNVTEAAIRIEHPQSLHHRLIEVRAKGAPKAAGSRFVEVLGGSFTSIGGYRTGFTRAEFLLTSLNHRVTILDGDSESCNRFIEATGSDTNQRPVLVLGGRFAIDQLTAYEPASRRDGAIVLYERRGPFTMIGTTFNGDPPAIEGAPHLRFAPQDGGAAFVEVTGCSFHFPHSATLADLIDATSSVRLVAHTNQCSAESAAAPCLGLAAGTASYGTRPATSGVLRVSSDGGLTARDAGDRADVNVAKLNPSDQVELGDATHVTLVPAGDGSGGLQVGRDGTPIAQVSCGAAAIDPPSIPGGSSGVGSGEGAAGLAAHDACTCSPRSDWADDLLLQGCYSTAHTLNVRLRNVGHESVDAGPVTVDYCCFRG